jgi:predicted MFS family arabinose efflux permease
MKWPVEDGAKNDGKRHEKRTFSSLNNRNFRLLWIGGMISHIGDEMQVVAVGWLVLVLTQSPFLMGVATLVQGVTRLIFGVIGGVIADRKDRHRLLIIYQGTEMLLAFFFSFLVLGGKIQYWQVLILLPFFSFLKAVYVVSRQAYVFDLVGKEELMNALALHSSGMNLAKIIGPSIAGVLIGLVGVGWCLFINGLSFVGILICFLLMRPPPSFRRDIQYPSILQDVRETFFYLMKDRIMLLLVVSSFSLMIFGLQSQIILPLFAEHVLNVGASGFGFLVSGYGAGAVIGGVIMAGLGDIKSKGRCFLLFALCYAVLIIFFSFSTWFVLSMLIILLVGMMEMSFRTINQTLVQLLSPDQLRARILGVYMLDRGIKPVGRFMVGAAASLLGAPLASALAGGTCALIALSLLIKSPRMREL